ncbi:aminodeoxychorismate lyase [Thioalkalivibrio sp. K90mix]|uniref:aminodeoxychorismate lyase n=1 Tax=Thioalkalivibrio sp. (strain K90mix) TaxID=396595 RepID=UPI000195A359|nr:aminodeoxychorismate lyase [Thioalkalivibrio sp. K90mix]ADC71764.1 aminodeoxychorismate lyase [Thioalkalivibrio sp. K90mix]
MILVNGVESCVPGDDRGLLLGDGLFETIMMEAGQPRLWRYHVARLERGLKRLGFPPADEALLREELQQVAPEGRCVARITITRGQGPRGYAPPDAIAMTRIVSGGALLTPSTGSDPVPLRMGWSRVAMAIQPALAGLKHTSRLEQVVIRQGWESGWDEAVVCDTQGRLVSATQGNLWWRQGLDLFTPPVDQAGIAGTRRAWVFDHAAACGLAVHEQSAEPQALGQVDGLYVSNARLGLYPARLIETDTPSTAWQDDPVRVLSMALHEAD